MEKNQAAMLIRQLIAEASLTEVVRNNMLMALQVLAQPQVPKVIKSNSNPEAKAPEGEAKESEGEAKAPEGETKAP